MGAGSTLELPRLSGTNKRFDLQETLPRSRWAQLGSSMEPPPQLYCCGTPTVPQLCPNHCGSAPGHPACSCWHPFHRMGTLWIGNGCMGGPIIPFLRMNARWDSMSQPVPWLRELHGLKWGGGSSYREMG